MPVPANAVRIVSLEAHCALTADAVFVETLFDDPRLPLIQRVTMDDGDTIITIQDALSGTVVIVQHNAPEMPRSGP